MSISKKEELKLLKGTLYTLENNNEPIPGASKIIYLMLFVVVIAIVFIFIFFRHQLNITTVLGLGVGFIGGGLVAATSSNKSWAVIRSCIDINKVKNRINEITA